MFLYFLYNRFLYPFIRKDYPSTICGVGDSPRKKKSRKLNKFFSSFFFSHHRLAYIGYGLCIVLSLISIIFVLLYGFQFGKIKSEAWVLAMLVSLLLSVFVVEPIKVHIFI